MSKSRNRDKIFILFIIGLIFSGSFGIQCARPSMPMGGPIDTIPPIIEDIYPPNYQTYLEPSEIIMVFNEFMQLKNQQTEIMFSPPMEVKPIVEVRGKTIVTTYPYDFEFDTTLTYHIDYGNALVDNNEGNPARQVRYVFSPGSKIDSLSMSGQSIDAKTGDTLINALVYMFEPILDTVTIDSTLFNEDAIVVGKTDSIGVYFMNHIKAKDYRVYVIEDKNNNGMYDVGEERVGFIDSTLNPAKLPPFKIWFDPISRQIYASPQVHFRMFTEVAYTRQKLEEVVYSENYKIIFKFASAGVEIDSLIIDSVPQDAMMKMLSKNRDSLTVWFKHRKYPMPDTVQGYVRYMGIDTLGEKAFVNEDFIVEVVKLSNEDIAGRKDAKRVAAKELTFWERFLRWIRFRHNRQIKKAREARVTEYRRIQDSLRNDPEALLRLRIDSLRLDSIRIDSLKIDSIRLDSITQFKIDSMNILRPSINPQQDYNPNKNIYIETNYPLETLVMDSIKLFKYAKGGQEDENFFDEKQAAAADKKRKRTEEKVVFERDSLDYTRYKLIADWIEDAEYEFEILPKAMIDILGASNDSITHVFKTVESRKTSTVIIEATDVEGCYFIELVREGGSVEYKHIVTKDSTYTSELLPVGKYKIKVTKDDNCNGEFDDGNLIKRIMPEEIQFHVSDRGISDIELKENFEFVESISIKAMFNPVFKQQKQDEKDEARRKAVALREEKENKDKPIGPDEISMSNIGQDIVLRKEQLNELGQTEEEIKALGEVAEVKSKEVEVKKKNKEKKR